LLLASGWEETKFQDQCGYNRGEERTLPNMPLLCQSLAAVWFEEYSRDVKDMVSRKIGMLIGYMLRVFVNDRLYRSVLVDLVHGVTLFWNGPASSSCDQFSGVELANQLVLFHFQSLELFVVRIDLDPFNNSSGGSVQVVSSILGVHCEFFVVVVSREFWFRPMTSG